MPGWRGIMRHVFVLPTPMPSSYQILYQFQAVPAAEGVLLEIRRLGLPADAPKSQVYQWLWLRQGGVQALHFVRMERVPQWRAFAEGLLQFDAHSARWQPHPNGPAPAQPSLALLPVSEPQLSPALQALLLQHLQPGP